VKEAKTLTTANVNAALSYRIGMNQCVNPVTLLEDARRFGDPKLALTQPNLLSVFRFLFA
jgi:hypothetical protein